MTERMSGTAVATRPFVEDADFRLWLGDVRQVLPLLLAEGAA